MATRVFSALMLGTFMSTAAFAGDHKHADETEPHAEEAHAEHHAEDGHDDHHTEEAHDEHHTEEAHDEHHTDDGHDDQDAEEAHDEHHADHDDHDHAEDEHETASGSAHVHGAWSMFAALDQDTLTVTLTGPLQDVLGFESQPSSPEQKAAVNMVLEDLSDADALMLVDAAGGCEAMSAPDVVMPEGFIATDGGAEDDHEEHEGDHHDEHEHDDDHSHESANVDVTVTYDCDRPTRLGGISVNLFSMYPAIETMDAVFLSDAGQSAVRLTAESREIRVQ